MHCIYSVCDILSNANGLIVPKLTQLSYETVQDITYNTDFPTVMAQNTLINTTALDDLIIWRSTASELLSVIRSMVVGICPAVVVLVESTENVPFSLTSVLPNPLLLSNDATVDIMIVRYNSSDNFTSEIESAIINAGAMINASDMNNAACSSDQFQSGITLVLNSPVYDADAILTTVSKR